MTAKTKLSHWQTQPDAPESDRIASSDYVASNFENFTFFEDKTVDNLMQVVISLGAEMWTMRRRSLVVEALAAQGVPASAQAIEAYQPSESEEDAWTRERDIFIERAFGALATDGVMGTIPPAQAQAQAEAAE